MSSNLVALALFTVLVSIPSWGQFEASSLNFPATNPSDKGSQGPRLNYLNQFNDDERRDLNRIVTGISDPYEALEISSEDREQLKLMNASERLEFIQSKYKSISDSIDKRLLELTNSHADTHDVYNTFVKSNSYLEQLNINFENATGDGHKQADILKEIEAESEKLKAHVSSNSGSISAHERNQIELDSLSIKKNSINTAKNVLQDPQLYKVTNYLLPKTRGNTKQQLLNKGSKLVSWAHGSLGFSIGMIGNVVIRCHVLEDHDKAICKSLYNSFTSPEGMVNLLVFSAAADIPREWALSLIKKGEKSPFTVPFVEAAGKSPFVSRSSRLFKGFLLRNPAWQTGLGMVMGSLFSRMTGKMASSEAWLNTKADVRELKYTAFGQWSAAADRSEKDLKELHELRKKINQLKEKIKVSSASPDDKTNLKNIEEQSKQLAIHMKELNEEYVKKWADYKQTANLCLEYSASFFLDIGRTGIAAFKTSPEELKSFARDTINMLITTSYINMLESAVGALTERMYFGEKIGPIKFKGFNAAKQRKMIAMRDNIHDPNYRYALRNEIEFFGTTKIDPLELRAVGNSLKGGVAEEIPSLLPKKFIARRLLSPSDWRGLMRAFGPRVFGFVSPLAISAVSATLWTLADEYLTKRFLSTNESTLLLPTRLNEAWGYTPDYKGLNETFENFVSAALQGQYALIPLASLSTVTPVEKLISSWVPGPPSPIKERNIVFSRVAAMVESMGKLWDEYRGEVISFSLNQRLNAWSALVGENHSKFIQKKMFLSLFDRVRKPGIPRWSFKYLPSQIIPNPYEGDSLFIDGSKGSNRWHEDPENKKSFGDQVAQFLPQYNTDVDPWIAFRRSMDKKEKREELTDKEYFKNYLIEKAEENEHTLNNQLKDDSNGKGATTSLTKIVNSTYYWQNQAPTFFGAAAKYRQLNNKSLPFNIRSSFWAEIFDFNLRILLVIRDIEGYTTSDHKPIQEVQLLKKQILDWNAQYSQSMSVDPAHMDAYAKFLLALPEELNSEAQIHLNSDLINHRIDFLLIPLAAKLGQVIEQYSLIDDTVKHLISPTFSDEDIENDALDTKPLTQAERYSLSPSEQVGRDKQMNDKRVKMHLKKISGAGLFDDLERMDNRINGNDGASPQTTDQKSSGPQKTVISEPQKTTSAVPVQPPSTPKVPAPKPPQPEKPLKKVTITKEQLDGAGSVRHIPLQMHGILVPKAGDENSDQTSDPNQ